MADDGAPKSSFDIAMERLRKKDVEEGVTARPMTGEQKAALAEVRSMYEAKLAEQEILQQAAMNSHLAADPTELDEIGRQFRRERERLVSERDARLEKIRRGDA